MGRNRLEELRHATPDEDASAVELTPLNRAASNEVDNKEIRAMDYLAQYDAIISRLQSLRSNVDALRQLQGSLLTATHRKEEEEQRVQALVTENKKLAQKIQADLKSEQEVIQRLEKRQQQGQEAKLSSKSDKLQPWKGKKKKVGLSDEERTELRLRRTQMQAQSRRFFELWQEYNEQQIEFRDKSKRMLVRRCKVANANFTDDQIEQMLDDNKHADVFATSILDQSRLARQQLNDLQDRHDELIKLEQSLEEMHAMFVDLATLVQDQGETVNTIAKHVEMATLDVEQGRDHLNKAKAAQKAARRKKVWCFTILFIVVFIVLLVLAIDLGLFGMLFGGSNEGQAKVVERIYVPVTQDEQEQLKKQLEG